MEKIQALSELETLLAKIFTKSFKEKLDGNVISKDIVHTIGYRTLNKSPIIKL